MVRRVAAGLGRADDDVVMGVPDQVVQLLAVLVGQNVRRDAGEFCQQIQVHLPGEPVPRDGDGAAQVAGLFQRHQIVDLPDEDLLQMGLGVAGEGCGVGAAGDEHLKALGHHAVHDLRQGVRQTVHDLNLAVVKGKGGNHLLGNGGQLFVPEKADFVLWHLMPPFLHFTQIFPENVAFYYIDARGGLPDIRKQYISENGLFQVQMKPCILRQMDSNMTKKSTLLNRQFPFVTISPTLLRRRRVHLRCETGSLSGTCWPDARSVLYLL